MIGLRIFVSSPNDIEALRAVVLKVIEGLRSDLEVDDISIAGEDWRGVPGDPGVPQRLIDPDIIRADVLILIVGTRIGSGTSQELALGTRLYSSGQLQSLMLYFQRLPQDTEISPEIQKVLALREQLNTRYLYHEFDGSADLQELVRSHLVRWVAPLRTLPRFRSKYGARVDPVLVSALNVPKPPPIDEIVTLESIPWEQELPDGNDVYDYRRYLGSRDGRPFDVDMLACYRVARYLFRQVLADNPLTFRDRPFTTFIHRYLADHVRRARDADDPAIERYLGVLRSWLGDRARVYTNARSFAAYQLGMCRDQNGSQALLAAVDDPNDNVYVRRYAALALGMMRTRASIAALVAVHDRDDTPRSLQDAIGHALLAAAGLLRS